MQASNAQIAETLVRGFSREGVEGAIAHFDERVRWTTAEDEPDHQTYTGLEGVQRLFDAWTELWEAGFEASAEPLEFITRGDHVIVPVRAEVRGRSSGADVVIEETYIFTFADNKIIRVREYRTKDEALEALEAFDGATAADGGGGP